jgi:hypothetical protein
MVRILAVGLDARRAPQSISLSERLSIAGRPWQTIGSDSADAHSSGGTAPPSASAAAHCNGDPSFTAAAIDPGKVSRPTSADHRPAQPRSALAPKRPPPTATSLKSRHLDDSVRRLDHGDEAHCARLRLPPAE